MKHLKLPLTPLLPAIATYTSRLDLVSPSDTTTLPMPQEPLPADTPLPISYALELWAEILVEQGKTEEARKVYAQLRDEADRMRAAYWDHRLRAIA